MRTTIPSSEHRTIEQLKEHYEVEKELSSRLRNASTEQRRLLYQSQYDELYKRIRHHPSLMRKNSPQDMKKAAHSQMLFLKRFLHPRTVLMEIGAGNCGLAFTAAKLVKRVYGIEVSAVITECAEKPENFELIIYNGTDIPLPDNCVTLAYSHQVIEHLHPDDAYGQMQNIYRILAPGGIYVCVTVNRLNGPHDISKYFDKEATGFHLKEYTITELSNLFKKIGFTKIHSYVGAKGLYVKIPLPVIRIYEFILELFPYSLRYFIACSALFKLPLAIRLTGTK